MTKIRFVLITIVALSISGCSSENENFPLSKRYWEPIDYANATRELKYGFESDEKLPTFNDPETRAIVQKYTDHQNFNIVLEDNQLGVKHRNAIAQKFFNRWKDMTTVYSTIDRQDKYIYEREMLEVEHFGLDLQLKYFKLGNDEILESADDPNSSRAKGTINSNIKTLISNFTLYLDEINNEDAYSDDGKKLFAKGIDMYFSELIEIYPTADYRAMNKKIDLLTKKSNSNDIISSLQTLKDLIESKKSQD